MKDKLERWLPSPFALLAIITIFIAGICWYNTSLQTTVFSWMDGYKNCLHYTIQTTLVFLAGYIITISPIVSKFVVKIVSIPKTIIMTIIVLCLVSSVLSFLNWALPMICGGLLANAASKRFPDIPKRIFVVAGVSGFALMHLGLSGTIAILSNTPGHPYESTFGLISVSDTLFGWKANLLRTVMPFVFSALCIWQVPKELRNTIGINIEDKPKLEIKKLNVSFASFFNESYLMNIFFAVMCFTGITYLFITDTFSWNLNTQLIILLGIGMLFYKGLSEYNEKIKIAVSGVYSMLIQYPLYGALQTILISSGVAVILSNALVSISNDTTFPLFTYIGFVIGSIPVPSAVGSWLVQGVVFIDAAIKMHISIADLIVTIGIAKGMWFLICPFWMLPTLAVTNINYTELVKSAFCLFLVGSIISILVLLC